MLITSVQPHNSFSSVLRSHRTTSSLEGSPKVTNVYPKKQKGTSLISKMNKTKTGSNDTMAKKKVILDLKLQEAINKTIGQKLQSIDEHKEDLVKKKQILANILKEYEQISQDKNLLTAEIKNMRKYLTEIRSKLNQSLVVLNKSTNLFVSKKGITRKLLLQVTQGPTAKKRRIRKGRKSSTEQSRSELSSMKKSSFL